MVVALSAVTLQVKAQHQFGGQGYFQSTPTHGNLDTANNTTPLTQLFVLPGYWDVVSVQATFTKISGTTIAGSASLYGSIDNVGFTLIGSAYTVTNVTAQTASWSITSSIFKYYKLVVTPSGTESVQVQSPILWRRRPTN